MLRYVLFAFIALPAIAAPGPEAAEDMRCAALLARVGDALEAAGHHSTLPTVREMQTGFVDRAGAGSSLMVELARTPPVALPASPDVLARIEACAMRHHTRHRP